MGGANTGVSNMQFYIIDPSPDTNADILPAYALKRVNLREGWQIISDIGHRFGFEWDGQTKEYNPHHPLTRSFSYRGSFTWLFLHYIACLDAYIARDLGQEDCVARQSW